MVRAARSRPESGASPDTVLSSTKNGRVAKSKPKPKKPKKRSETVPLPKKPLDRPLSQLAADMNERIIDVEAFVNRGTIIRHAEVMQGKKPGKVKRPMNAFILYRKAYQLVCKKYCLENNHQVVSRVCGDSWKSESTAVRDKFIEWAKVDRDQLQIAHPDYKFTPSKPRSAYLQPVRSEMDDSDDDYEYVPATYRIKDRSRGRGTPDSGYCPDPNGRNTPMIGMESWSSPPAPREIALPTSNPYQSMPYYFHSQSSHIVHQPPNPYNSNDSFGIVSDEYHPGSYRPGSTPPDFVDGYMPRSSASPANVFEHGIPSFPMLPQHQHRQPYPSFPQQQQHAYLAHSGQGPHAGSSQLSIDPSLAGLKVGKHTIDTTIPSNMPGMGLGAEDQTGFESFYLAHDPLLEEGIDNGTLGESWDISEIDAKGWQIQEVE